MWSSLEEILLERRESHHGERRTPETGTETQARGPQAHRKRQGPDIPDQPEAVNRREGVAMAILCPRANPFVDANRPVGIEAGDGPGLDIARSRIRTRRRNPQETCPPAFGGDGPNSPVE